jgi:DNA-binding transcriptional ArsR family regulator
VSSISRLLSRGASGESAEPEDPDVIAIEDEAAEDVFSALSSNTARAILSRLYEEPGTASGVASDVDTSLQNANYHLNNLTEADLIEVRDVRYSDQGKEMRVYAPTNRALVLFASEDVDRSSLFETVKRLLLPVGALAIVSVAVDVMVGSVLSPPASPTDTDTGLAVTPTPVEMSGSTAFALPPGALFFLGGLLALLLFYFVYEK